MSPYSLRHSRLPVTVHLASSLDLASVASAQEAAVGRAPSAVHGTGTHTAIPGIDADMRLLPHIMLGVGGRQVPATTLLLVPNGTPPVRGWPTVA